MKRNTLLTLILISIVYSAKAQISRQEKTKIDSIFNQWDNPEAPGGAIGIIKKGKLIYSKGYGAANLEYNIPNSTQSVFLIASTSKQFTAACIILLTQQGKLSLDDKLIKFFPDFSSYAHKVTIKHLLHHTSGINDYLGLKRIAGLDRKEDYFTDKEVRKWLANLNQTNFEPGKKLSYSNSGYWLLGQIVKEISGLSLAKYAEKHIFGPLNMTNTHFHDNHKQIVKNRAFGYAPNDQNGFDINMHTLDMIGDGGVYTNIEDLKKWDDAFYNSKILNKDFWNQMTSVGILNNGVQLNYAAGLGIENYKGLKVIRHGGGFVGYRAEMIRFPEQRFSVIFLANRADVDPSRKAFQIADIFLHYKYKKKQSINKKGSKTIAQNITPTASLSIDQLKLFEGIYWNDSEKISRRIELRNDTLHYVRSNGRTTKILPVSNEKFKWLGYNILMNFDRNNTQKSFSLLIPNEEPSFFKEYTPINTLDSLTIKKYSGDYYNKDLDIFYSLRTEKNNINFYVNGRKIDSLKPIMKNVFANPAQKNLILEFDENANSFKLSIDRIYNLRFVKKYGHNLP